MLLWDSAWYFNICVLGIFPNAGSLLTQKSQSKQITTSQIKKYPGLMGFLCSRVAPPRGNQEATNGTTGRKEKRPLVSPLGAHINTLWEWSGPSPDEGSGPGMLGFGVQTNTTLRPGGWDGCKGLRSTLQLNNVHIEKR